MQKSHTNIAQNEAHWPWRPKQNHINIQKYSKMHTTTHIKLQGLREWTKRVVDAWQIQKTKSTNINNLTQRGLKYLFISTNQKSQINLVC